MKAKLEKLNIPEEASFNFHIAKHPAFHTPLHYHPEYEIIYIRESRGIRIAGDHASPFREGELAMMGPGLPHVWKNDPEYGENSSGLMAEAHVIHFSPDFWDVHFAALPECTGIRQLFNEASRGLLFSEEIAKKAGSIMNTMTKIKGMIRLDAFIRLLGLLSEDKHRKPLASAGYSEIKEQDPRIRKVLDYILANYLNDLREEDLSKLIGMNTSAFSRFFRANVYKTFKRFVIELRLSQACKLLLESDKHISEICFESGFNNLSNFNELFLKQYQETPVEYRHRVRGE
jgi:AraC-like DNA-binding protein